MSAHKFVFPCLPESSHWLFHSHSRQFIMRMSCLCVMAYIQQHEMAKFWMSPTFLLSCTTVFIRPHACIQTLICVVLAPRLTQITLVCIGKSGVCVSVSLWMHVCLCLPVCPVHNLLCQSDRPCAPLATVPCHAPPAEANRKWHMWNADLVGCSPLQGLRMLVF